MKINKNKNNLNHFLANYYLLVGLFVIAQALFVVLSNNSAIGKNQNVQELENNQISLQKEIRDLENEIANNQSLTKNKTQSENETFIEISNRELVSAEKLPVLIAQN